MVWHWSLCSPLYNITLWRMWKIEAYLGHLRVAFLIKNAQMALRRRLPLVYKMGLQTRTCTKCPYILGGGKKYSSPRNTIVPQIIRYTCIKEIGMNISNPGLEVHSSSNALRGKVMKLAPTLPQKLSTFIEMMKWKWWHWA